MGFKAMIHTLAVRFPSRRTMSLNMTDSLLGQGP